MAHFRQTIAFVSRERLTGVIVGMGFIGVLLTAWLVFSQLFRGPTCPDLLGIPACFAVLGAYVLATGAAWFPESRRAAVVFYASAGAALVIAIWFSYCEVRGTASCPTFEGLPMCFTSLLGAATIIGVDVLRRLLPE
jgi:hypothetical protein